MAGKDQSGSGWIALLVLVGVVFIALSLLTNSKPKCIKSECNNDQVEGSSYCYLHKPYKSSGYSGSTTTNSSSSSSGSSSSASSSSSGTSTKNYSNSTGKSNSSSASYSSSSKKKKYHDTYDDGYDDVYFDEDYDIDRYNGDSDYANGVDDAMDEMGEDW